MVGAQKSIFDHYHMFKLHCTGLPPPPPPKEQSISRKASTCQPWPVTTTGCRGRGEERGNTSKHLTSEQMTKTEKKKKKTKLKYMKIFKVLHNFVSI